MATYLELKGLRSNSDLQDNVEIAASKKAQELIDGATPTAAEIEWANATIQHPEARVPALLNYLLAKNSNATVEQIKNVSDEAIQTAVNGAVDILITGGIV